MDTKFLDEIIKKLLLSKNSVIYITDVFKDEITFYKLDNDKLSAFKKEQLTTYLESISSIVDASYLKGYMEIFSIPKYKEELKNGNDKINFKYKDLNNKWYVVTSMLVNLSTSSLIVSIIDEEKSDNLSNFKKNNDEKYNSLISSLSDSMLKIYNAFNININKVEDIKKIEEYINVILSNLSNKYIELKKSFNKNAIDVSSMAYDTILIVDDDLVTRNMIKKVFNDEYKIATATNGKEAIDYLESNKNKSRYDSSDNVLGIFLDLTMPVMDGFAVLEYLSRNNYLSKIPVIIISGDYEKETKKRVYSYNIADMLEKPFDFEVVKHRISNFINLYKSSNALSNLITEQNKDLRNLIDPFINNYEFDYKEDIKCINSYIKILLNSLKDINQRYLLTDEKINKIADSSKYYDIGFYYIPRKILSKNKNLTNDDLDIIKKYPLFSADLIEYVLSMISDIKYKEYAINIAKYYHENYDGTGYPNSLKEDGIPVEAQVSKLAIMYNSLKKKMSDPKDIIISKKGSLFNPDIVDAFIKVSDEFLNVK